MKKINKPFVIIVVFLTIMGLVWAKDSDAASVTFEWYPNPPEEKVSNYKIHIGNASRQYTIVKDAGTATTLTVPNVADGHYFAAATAHDDEGNKSDYSNEIQFEVRTKSGSSKGLSSGTNTFTSSGQAKFQ